MQKDDSEDLKVAHIVKKPGERPLIAFNKASVTHLPRDLFFIQGVTCMVHRECRIIHPRFKRLRRQGLLAETLEDFDRIELRKVDRLYVRLYTHSLLDPDMLVYMDPALKSSIEPLVASRAKSARSDHRQVAAA